MNNINSIANLTFEFKEKAEYYKILSEIYDCILKKYPQASTGNSYILKNSTIYNKVFREISNIPKVNEGMYIFTDKNVNYNYVKILELPGYVYSPSDMRSCIIGILIDKINCSHISNKAVVPVFSEPIVLATSGKSASHRPNSFSYHVNKINGMFHQNEDVKKQTYEFCKEKVIQWMLKDPISNDPDSLFHLPPDVIEYIKNSKILQ